MCRWVSHFHLCSCLFFLSHPSFPTNSPDLRRVGGVQRRRFGLVALEGKIRKAALSCWTAAQGTWRDLAAPRLCSEELGCSWGLGVCCFFVGELSWSSIFQVSKCSIWNPIGYGETGWFGRTVFFWGFQSTHLLNWPQEGRTLPKVLLFWSRIFHPPKRWKSFSTEALNSRGWWLDLWKTKAMMESLNFCERNFRWRRIFLRWVKTCQVLGEATN